MPVYSTANASRSPINGRENLNSDPTRNFRFLVEFFPYNTNHPMKDPINFGFTSVAGLSMAVESIPYREGGMNTTLHQIPGQATFSPITLTRGVHLGNQSGMAIGSIGSSRRWVPAMPVATRPISSAPR